MSRPPVRDISYNKNQRKRGQIYLLIKETILGVGASVLSVGAEAAEVLDYVDPTTYIFHSGDAGGALYGPGTDYPTYEDYQSSVNE